MIKASYPKNNSPCSSGCLESMYEDIVFDGKPLKTIKVVRRIKGTSFCEIYYYGYKKGLIKEDVVKENGQIETLFKLKKIYKLKE